MAGGISDIAGTRAITCTLMLYLSVPAVSIDQLINSNLYIGLGYSIFSMCVITNRSPFHVMSKKRLLKNKYNYSAFS